MPAMSPTPRSRLFRLSAIHLPTARGALPRGAGGDDALTHAGLLRRDARRRLGLLPLGAALVESMVGTLAESLPGGPPQPVVVADEGDPVELMVALARQDLRSYRELPLGLSVRRGARLHVVVLASEERGVLAGVVATLQRAGLPASLVARRAGLAAVAVDDAGPEAFLACSHCGAGATPDLAAVAPARDTPADAAAEGRPELVATPGARRVEEVCAALSIEPAQLLKTLLWTAQGGLHAAVVPGDRELSEAKLASVLGARSLALALGPEVERLTGAPLGFAGPIGLDVPLVVDASVGRHASYVTGANRADHHLVGVRLARDLKGPWEVADLALARVGDQCGGCRLGALEERRGWALAWGGLADAGVRVDGLDGGSTALVAEHVVLDGVEALRAFASASLAQGPRLALPASAYPAPVVVVALDDPGGAVAAAAEGVAAGIAARGLAVALDDRAARAGRKLADAELLGWPVRVLVGRRSLERGEAELAVRTDHHPRRVGLDEVAGDAVAAGIRVTVEEGGL